MISVGGPPAARQWIRPPRVDRVEAVLHQRVRSACRADAAGGRCRSRSTSKATRSLVSRFIGGHIDVPTCRTGCSLGEFMPDPRCSIAEAAAGTRYDQPETSVTAARTRHGLKSVRIPRRSFEAVELIENLVDGGGRDAEVVALRVSEAVAYVGEHGEFTREVCCGSSKAMIPNGSWPSRQDVHDVHRDDVATHASGIST